LIARLSQNCIRKASGLGRENCTEAIEGYLQTKSVWINNDPAAAIRSS